jgi:hypothetical protein
VLASVPDTSEAKDAVLIAQIPTTMVLNPATVAAQANVVYTGTPQFAPIQGTTLEYATNTNDKVTQVGDLYYLCLQGVWFMATTPQGPWTTAGSVPPVIYTIPPSSSVCNVTYVTQTTASDGNIQASYTAGYLGAFAMGAAVGAIVCSGSKSSGGWSTQNLNFEMQSHQSGTAQSDHYQNDQHSGGGWGGSHSFGGWGGGGRSWGGGVWRR